MADTFTEGYRIGFELTGKDLSKKKTVNIRYCLGFERLVRAEIKNFEKLGLKPTIYRAAVNTINKRLNIKVGYYGANPNKQMDFDHRFDNALYMDGEFVERKTGALKLAYEKNKELAAVHGGPAVMEVFGEVPFEPQIKSEALTLDTKQQKLSVKYSNDAGSIVNEYIKGEERSFTIIAYPIPEIGENFEEIFKGTVKINTLDYNKYKAIQKALIDVLDTAQYVEVKGTNGNSTDMKVSIMKITDHKTQTVFENCLADVNIPLGEVFTSPVLKKTTGVLNVSSVYLNDIKFNNLTVWFEDGFVKDYTCTNFEDEAKNKELFKANVLYDHETLPLGELAIGTNTTAYVFANKHDIVYKLPILIVEKMGPHFAVGDTCYSRAEDVYVTNPDGKEIISRDNEVSLLRKTEPDKAYYNCHTDITIPIDIILKLVKTLIIIVLCFKLCVKIKPVYSLQLYIYDSVKNASLSASVPSSTNLPFLIKSVLVPSSATTVILPISSYGIVMGSDSDMPVMAKAADILEQLGISYEMTIISAHREPNTSSLIVDITASFINSTDL